MQSYMTMKCIVTSNNQSFIHTIYLPSHTHMHTHTFHTGSRPSNSLRTFKYRLHYTESSVYKHSGAKLIIFFHVK